VGRFFFSIWTAWTLSATMLLLFVWALYMGNFWDLRWGSLLPLWALFSWFSFRNLKNGQTKCWLSWDGAMWQILAVTPGPNPRMSLQAEYAMSVHLDLQKLLFVSLLNHKGEGHWFWLTQDSFPDRWHGFRCAVYSRAEAFSS
jgi:hypothetical protein